MKCLACLALALSLAAGAFAQNPVTSFSHLGNLTVSTASTQYVYTRGGSPRTGYYWYWRATQKQYTSKSLTIPVNLPTLPASAVGDYFQPSYYATGVGLVTRKSTATADTVTGSISVNTLFVPFLAIHQAAYVDEVAYDYATFTVGSNAHINFKATGNAGSVTLVDLASNEVISTGGSFNDTVGPGSYEVIERLFTHSSHDTQTGVIQNLGAFKLTAGYTITFTADTGN